VMFHKCERADELAPVTARKQRERRHCLVHVERVLEQAVRKGQLPKDTDTTLATQALHAYIAGIMHEWVLDRAAFDLAGTAPALIDVILAGLRDSPPRRRQAPKPRSCAYLPGLPERRSIGKA
jgi:TetR/AcrR family transcriptional regulator, acrAB operon repressor